MPSESASKFLSLIFFDGGDSHTPGKTEVGFLFHHLVRGVV